MIFQMHTDHGRHIAYSPLEAETNISNGWKTVSKKKFYDIGQVIEAESTEVKEDELSNHDKLSLSYEIKFGKKPHHAMKDSTIQQKLDE